MLEIISWDLEDLENIYPRTGFQIGWEEAQLQVWFYFYNKFIKTRQVKNKIEEYVDEISTTPIYGS